MRPKMKSNGLFFGLVVVTAALIGCSSAQPTGDPGVDRVGRYILISKGPEAEVAVGYRHAENSLGSEWLLLEIAMTSPPGQNAKIERQNVSVRTPAGVSIPLATQEEFGQAYSKLRPFLTAANVARDPMDYWPPRKEPCGIQFFVAPGNGIAFDEVSLNDYRACQGRFFFRVPGSGFRSRWKTDEDRRRRDGRRFVERTVGCVLRQGNTPSSRYEIATLSIAAIMDAVRRSTSTLQELRMPRISW